jgi:hypothetical protein
MANGSNGKGGNRGGKLKPTAAARRTPLRDSRTGRAVSVPF